MEIKDKNIEICRFLNLKETKPGCFQFANTKFKNLTTYKETSELKWHSDFNWLMLLSDHIEGIKDLTFCVQGNYASLYYKGTEVENTERPLFSCSREKSSKISAIYEVLSTFILWMNENKEAKSDMEYILHHISDGEEYKPIIYVVPSKPKLNKTDEFEE